MLSIDATVVCDDCGRSETVEARSLRELTRTFPPLGWWIVERRCPRDTDGDGDCAECAPLRHSLADPSVPPDRREALRGMLRAHLGSEHLCPDCVLKRPELPRLSMRPA